MGSTRGLGQGRCCGTRGSTVSTGEEPLERVLAQLDRWRHLPGYRLEPHVDVLFGLTLPRVIRSKFKTAGELFVIPEFPIHHKTVGIDNTNRSFNVDFAVLTHGGRCVFLVELKTDSKSIKKEQLDNMRKVPDGGLFPRLVDAVETIRSASDQSAKYKHLIAELCQAGAMKCGRAADTVAPKPKLVLISPRLEDIKVCTQGFHCIDFDEYASIITPSLEETFARYLRRWRSPPGQ